MHTEYHICVLCGKATEHPSEWHSEDICEECRKDMSVWKLSKSKIHETECAIRRRIGDV